MHIINKAFAIISAILLCTLLQQVQSQTVSNLLTAGTSTGCQLLQSGVLLGYNPGTGVKVYLNRCSGSCLSTSGAPTQCLLSTQSIRVTTRPFSNNAITSTQVTGCSCAPAPCAVTVAGVTTLYNHGAAVTDSCDRQCTCSFGTLINCCRQRKEFRLGLSSVEKQRFLNAYYTVSTNSAYRTTYAALINKHQTLFSTGIHGGALFLPWHREYIWDLENLLQQVDCRVTIPYWRWSLEASAPFSSTVWDATLGVGGNSASSGTCVRSGLYASPWTTAAGVCLSRSWSLGATFATEADVSQALDVDCSRATQFACMEGRIESFHNYVHSSIGGLMGGSQSSNDPVFFLHHTYIDRMWARWQSKSAAHTAAYSGSTATAHPGSTSTVAAWLDLNRQGNNANNRVCYIDPPNTWWVSSVLNPSISSSTLQSVSATSPSSSQQSSNVNAFTTQGDYQPLTRSCTTADRVRALPRIPLEPFPESFLRALNMSDDMIAEQRAFHDSRNNNSTIISVLAALTSQAPTSMMGFLLNDADLSCLNSGSDTLVLNTDTAVVANTVPPTPTGTGVVDTSTTTATSP